MITQELSNYRYVMDISDFKVKFGFKSEFGDKVWIYAVLRGAKNLW